MATPHTALTPAVDAWLTAWADWLDRWLAGGVEHPGASAVLALERWLNATAPAPWPALTAKARRLLDPDIPADDKAADLLDLVVWLEATRQARSRQRLAGGLLASK